MNRGQTYGVTLITGASSGLGAAYAKKIAAQTSELILVARSEDRLLQVVGEIKKNNPGLVVHAVSCDLSDPARRKTLLDSMRTRQINTLILNAGAGVFKKFLSATWEDHRKTVDLNVTANLDLAYHLLPGMLAAATRAQNPVRARLQAITSHSSELRVPHFSVYAPAKTFETLWMQTLALELRGQPIILSAICAGAIATEFSQRSGTPKMLSVAPQPEGVADRCIAKLDRAGTHYLSLYDRIIWAMNRYLPARLIDFLVTRIQSRYV